MMELRIEKIETHNRKFSRKHSNNANGLKVYIHPQGETLLENLFNRRERPYNLYKKQVIPAVLRHLGLDPAEVKARWSRYAGCEMCPCSPGFNIYVQRTCTALGERYEITPPGHEMTTVWVTVTGEEH